MNHPGLYTNSSFMELCGQLSVLVVALLCDLEALLFLVLVFF